MEKQKSSTREIELLLKEIGEKIEELVKKGAEAGAEVKVDLERKISDLRSKKTTLEDELKKAKQILEREFQEKKEEFEPRIKESKGFLEESVRQLGFAIKALLGSR